MSWSWRLENTSGEALDEPASPVHANQADAESWLGEQWRALSEAGVAQVTLLDSGAEVYGPMSLSEE